MGACSLSLSLSVFLTQPVWNVQMFPFGNGHPAPYTHTQTWKYRGERGYVPERSHTHFLSHTLIFKQCRPALSHPHWPTPASNLLAHYFLFSFFFFFVSFARQLTSTVCPVFTLLLTDSRCLGTDEIAVFSFRVFMHRLTLYDLHLCLDDFMHKHYGC